MVRGKSVCLFFATKLQKNSIYGQKTGNFYEIIRIQFPFGVHIPSLSVPDTVAPCFVYRCRSPCHSVVSFPRPPPLKTAFPPLLRRLMVVWEDFDKEMRDLCKISWILFFLFINFATDILCGLKAFLNRENMKILSLLSAIALVLLSCSAENEEIIAQQVQALSSVYVTVPDTSDAVTMETLKFRSRWMEYTDTKKEQPQTRAHSDVINLVSSQYNQWIAERGCQNRY